jgi:Protein of unknown function (DUF3467)
MRENRTSGSMRGCWRSSRVGLVRHRQTKGAGTARPDLPSGGQCSTLPSTREEVVLMFGVNQAWQWGQAEVVIQLTDRLILSPFAAKRLALLLQGVMREYETRFGELPVEPPRAG